MTELHLQSEKYTPKATHKFQPDRVINADQVDSVETFCEYAQSRLGVPFPGATRMPAVRSQVRIFFEQNPRCTWKSLVAIVDFCRARKKRVSSVLYIPALVGKAFYAGYLPELDPSEQHEPDVERGIEAALAVEKNPEWRRLLHGARGVTARRQVHAAWLDAQKNP